MKKKRLIKLLLSLFATLPKRYKIAAAPEDLSCKPFYVISCGRSGSTLLASLLDSHSKLSVPPEEFVLANSVVKYRLYNFLEWKDICGIITAEFLRAAGTMDWKLQSPQVLIQELYDLPAKERSFEKIIDMVFCAYLEQNGQKGRSWGNKSPMLTDQFDIIYPAIKKNARFIGLIRDGRDVITSILKKNQEADAIWAGKKWENSIKHIDHLEKTLAPQDFLLVKYENLVEKPVEVLTKVLQFLQFEYEETMLLRGDYLKKLGRAGKLEAFQNVANPISKSSVGRWKTNLKEEDLNLAMPYLKDGLKKYGYEL
jgi:protein-tyrosine sulfotransferase